MPPPLATVLPVRLGWAVVLVGVGAALAAAAGVPARATYGARVTADEPQYLLTAISLAEDHDLDISDELRQERWRPFHEALLPQQSEVQRDGSELSPHDPLLPAILAVPVALGGWIGAKLAIAVIAGILAGLLVWVAVRRFAVPVRPAAVVVGVFAITPPLTVYGAQIYPELPAALALTVVIAAATGPLTTRGRIAATLGVVALPWLSVKYVPVAAVLAALVLWLVHARLGAAPALAVGAVLAVMGAGYLTFHHLVYGGWTVYAAGSHFAGGELTVAGEHPRYLGRSSRLLGLLTDRTYGLAARAPAYILTVGALAALARRRPPGWLVLVLPVVAGAAGGRRAPSARARDRLVGRAGGAGGSLARRARRARRAGRRDLGLGARRRPADAAPSRRRRCPRCGPRPGGVANDPARLPPPVGRDLGPPPGMAGGRGLRCCCRLVLTRREIQ